MWEFTLCGFVGLSYDDKSPRTLSQHICAVYLDWVLHSLILLDESPFTPQVCQTAYPRGFWPPMSEWTKIEWLFWPECRVCPKRTANYCSSFPPLPLTGSVSSCWVPQCSPDIPVLVMNKDKPDGKTSIPGCRCLTGDTWNDRDYSEGHTWKCFDCWSFRSIEFLLCNQSTYSIYHTHHTIT